MKTKQELYDAIQLPENIKKKVIKDMDALLDTLLKDGVMPYYTNKMTLEELGYKGKKVGFEVDDRNNRLFLTMQLNGKPYGPEMYWDADTGKLVGCAMREGYLPGGEGFGREIDLDVPNLHCIFHAFDPILKKHYDIDEEIPNISLAKAYPIWNCMEQAKEYKRKLEESLQGEKWERGRGAFVPYQYREVRRNKTFNGSYQERNPETGQLTDGRYVENGRHIFRIDYVNRLQTIFHDDKGTHSHEEHLGFYPDGGLECYMQSKNGNCHGVAYRFFEDGSPKEEKLFEYGQLLKETLWAAPGAEPKTYDYVAIERERERDLCAAHLKRIGYEPVVMEDRESIPDIALISKDKDTYIFTLINPKGAIRKDRELQKRIFTQISKWMWSHAPNLSAPTRIDAMYTVTNKDRSIQIAQMCQNALQPKQKQKQKKTVKKSQSPKMG